MDVFRWKIWYEFDYFTLLITAGLIGMGVHAIYGAAGEGSRIDSLWFHQIQWAVLGLVCLIAVVLIDYRVLVKYAVLFYLAGLGGLLLCFSPLVGHDSHGADSWIKIGGLPQVQPSEFAKLTTLLMLAWYLSNRRENWNGLWDVLRPLALGALPAALILIQPDLGTAVVYGPMTLLMMFVAGMPYGYLVMLLAPATCLFGVGHDWIFIVGWVAAILSLLTVALYARVPWTVWVPSLIVCVCAYVAVYQYGQQIWENLPKHQTNRIVGYLNPDFDPKGTTYNIKQAKIALGSGGFWGKGLGQGTQGVYEFLPEFQHDFVFAILGEQFGFMGGVVLLLLFLLLLVRGIDTAIETKTLSGALVATGVTAIFFSHILINIGMVTGLLPATGLPLTFISYGGSFMLCSMIAVGFLVNVRMRINAETLKDGFASGRPSMTLPRTIKDDF